MKMLTDETLMRYADSMLDRSERERIEQVLAQNARLRRRVQVFHITGSNLRSLFADHVNAPIPSKFRELLSPSDSKPAPSWLSALADLLHSRLFSPQWRYGTLRGVPALTAVLMAVTLGFGIGWTLRGGTKLDGLVRIQPNRLVAEKPLQSALEKLPSGAQVSIVLAGKEFRLDVKVTFRNGAGDYCREYEIAAPHSPRYAGLACRRDAQWTVEVHALMPSLPSGSGQPIPAGGNANWDMDAFVSALIDGDPLNAEQEAALLSGGWKSE